ncbi:serine threonine kinase protein [Rutstroemia sp. NJR-2017a WRK4]|nr:serine threonine kinase protein [Rutstroemia sp. NJR-2017a WRK4]
MAQTSEKEHGSPASNGQKPSWLRRIMFRKDDHNTPATPPPSEPQQPAGLARRISRKVVPQLPRAGTFKRQQSELRDRLEPVKPNPEERRTASVDRRLTTSHRSSSTAINRGPRSSAPEFLDRTDTLDTSIHASTRPPTANTITSDVHDYVDVSKGEKQGPSIDERSVSTDTFDEIMEELEKRWILNLSMHFRDKSKREKFFVTFAQTPTHWRRVTISLDYRDAPPKSLEEELANTRFQRDKSALIYEAIRESLQDIQFYDTVTNLKLQTEDERLHVHVVEDLAEVIHYPPVKAINHLSCRRVLEGELEFDSHLSGFVYKVNVAGQVFIKKEIPGPDQVDEFLYEINALHQLSGSHSVIQFGGVVLDNEGKYVKGLLISFAEQGALIDVIYDGEGRIPWERRERWAKQIVQGLSEIHEAGYVQGDFTLSNIVIDGDDNAKIIDINRRGCPVGWEPPEVAALIESNQRISMYIGVKSDLYQLGMVLYALATQHDEPETQRPLSLSDFPPNIPNYFLEVCGRCLSDDPRFRSQAAVLLNLFPEIQEYHSTVFDASAAPPIVIDVRHADEGGLLVTVHDHDARKGSYLKAEDYESPERGRSRSKPYEEFMNSKPVERAMIDSKFDEIRPSQIPLPPSPPGSDKEEIIAAAADQNYSSHYTTSYLDSTALENRQQNYQRSHSPLFKDRTYVQSISTTADEPRITEPVPIHTFAEDLAGVGSGVEGPFDFGVVNLDEDLTIDNEISMGAGAGTMDNVLYITPEEHKVPVA